MRLLLVLLLATWMVSCNIRSSDSNPSDQSASKITLGASVEKVKQLLGAPTTQFPGSLYYPGGKISVENGKVAGWFTQNLAGLKRLKIRVKRRHENLSSFNIGSTLEQVFSAQGTPTRLDVDLGTGRTLIFMDAKGNRDRVFFSKNKVEGYQNLGGILKIKNLKVHGKKGSIYLGTSVLQVQQLLGPPDIYTSYGVLHFKRNRIVIVDGKVQGWLADSPAKLNDIKIQPPVTPQHKNLTSFKIGSTLEEVIAVQGTPTEMSIETGNERRLKFQGSGIKRGSVYLRNNKVRSVRNLYGILKFK